MAADDAPRARGDDKNDAIDDDEDEEARERYRELLEELRTILPGVQVLFAFLLTAPFSSRFGELDEFGRDLYAAALIGVALATVVFLTPAAHHRVNQHSSRHRRLRVGVWCTVVGLGLLAAAICTSVFVVARFVFDDGAFALLLGGTVGVSVIGLWYVFARVPRRLGH